MNLTIAVITARAMLGRKRTLLLLALPAFLLALAVLLRLTENNDLSTAKILLHQFAIATLLPLLGVIAGTGVIGPEIDDGQIMYLLTKPIPRPVISSTKLAVAIAIIALFGAVPTLGAGLIMVGTEADLAAAFAIGALAGGVAYCALFVALAVVTRYPVVIGLLYALIWETTIGNLARGAKTLSIQQWAYSISDVFTTATDVTATVKPSTAVPMLVALTVLGAVVAGWRLRSLAFRGPE
jgi:ABC-2 type transport system permease protein